MDANLKKSRSRIFAEIDNRLPWIMPSTAGPQAADAT
jgi:hypothetical protein